MLALMAISLYTTRILLSTLGVNDFGIISVVGSVTATFYSLRSVFAEAIQRFLNYEKGRKNIKGEIQVFNIAVILHVFIALVFVLLVEIGGTWLLENKLTIDENSIDVAYFVFHLTVLSSALSILIIPYDALIIANEKMNVYAWVSIFDGIAKLLLVLSLPYIPFNHLKTYSVLLAVIPLINLIVYIIYCNNFKECKYSFKLDKQKIKEISTFSGWSFGGNLIYTLVHEGLNIILNIFGGVVSNAARNIAYQLRAAVNQLSNNTLLATKPFVLQNAAEKDDGQLLSYITNITRANFFIMTFTCVPVLAFCEGLLSIWLIEIPNNAGIITQFVILSVYIRSIHGPLNLYYMGKGKIKRMVLIESLLLLMLLPVCYIELVFGFSVWSIYITLSIIELFIILALTLNIKFEFKSSVQSYFKQGILPCLQILLLFSPIIYICSLFYENTSIIVTLLMCFFMSIFTIIILYCLFIDKNEKHYIRNILIKFGLS